MASATSACCPELIVNWPPGYENSTPVRIGNALPGLLAALGGLVAMAAPSQTTRLNSSGPPRLQRRSFSLDVFGPSE